MKKSIKHLSAMISALFAADVSSNQQAIEQKDTQIPDYLKGIKTGVLNVGMPAYLAAHRSHSSHASHGSHRSHRSSSGSFSAPVPTPSPSPQSEPLGQPARPKSSIPKKVEPKLEQIMSDTQKRRNIIMRVQLTLQALGYYNGTVDGVMGSETRSAINQYRTSKGITESEKLDTETLNSLGILVQ